MWCCWWAWEHPDQLAFLPGTRRLCAAAFLGGVLLPTHPHAQSSAKATGRAVAEEEEWVARVSPWPTDAVAAQGSPWGETHSGRCLGDGADPLSTPSPAPRTPPFRQGDAGQGVSVGEPQRYGASLSLSCCCAGVGTASECLKGLFYMLLLHKL